MMGVTNSQVGEVGKVARPPGASDGKGDVNDRLHGLGRGGEEVGISQEADDRLVGMVRVMKL